MVNWLKLFGVRARGHSPVFDTPEITAQRVKTRRAKDFTDWQKVKPKGDLPDKVTRKDVDKIPTKQGFVKRHIDGEGLFLKQVLDRTLVLFFNLKSVGESETYAPMQRLLVSASMATQAYAAIEAEIIGGQSADLATMASLDQCDIRDYFLTPARVENDLRDIETRLCAIDADAVLA